MKLMTKVLVIWWALAVSAAAHSNTSDAAGNTDNSELLFSATTLGATSTITSSGYYEVGGDDTIAISWRIAPGLSVFGETIAFTPLWTLYGEDSSIPAQLHGGSQTVTVTGPVASTSVGESIFTVTPPPRARRMYLKAVQVGTGGVAVTARAAGTNR